MQGVGEGLPLGLKASLRAHLVLMINLSGHCPFPRYEAQFDSTMHEIREGQPRPPFVCEAKCRIIHTVYQSTLTLSARRGALSMLFPKRLAMQFKPIPFPYEFYCPLSSASSTVAVRLVIFWPSELLPATAELEPSATLPKLQLDSSELGSACFDDEAAVGLGALGAPDEAGRGCELSVRAGAFRLNEDIEGAGVATAGTA